MDSCNDGDPLIRRQEDGVQLASRRGSKQAIIFHLGPIEPEFSFDPFDFLLCLGWSDDRVESLGLPFLSMLLPRLIHPMGFNGSPFLLDPESIPRVVSFSFWSSIVGKKLYVGNLTYNVNESDLEALFTPFGTVQSAQVIVDRDTNRSKGFGFVEMGSDAEAQAAIQGLNGRDHDGRNLTVNEAKPREDRGGGGGGRGGGGRGGYGGGGGGGGGYGGGGGRRY
jgi:cold-inducible RNA-binding protein